jgi:hypothetical protein
MKSEKDAGDSPMLLTPLLKDFDCLRMVLKSLNKIGHLINCHFHPLERLKFGENSNPEKYF